MKRSSVGARVSIVIRTHGERQAMLRRALASAVAQTYADLEIIVVEDGSDRARAMVNAVAESTAVPIIFESIGKAGRSAAGNAGVARATGRYVGFLDDDDELMPDHAATLAEALDTAPDAPAAYAGTVETRTSDVDAPDGLSTDLSETEFPAQSFSLKRLWQYNFLPIQSVLFRRAAWQTEGGLDERLDALEDWDLWLRLANLGDFAMCDGVTSRYRVPADAGIQELRAHHHRASRATIRQKQRALAMRLPAGRRFDGIAGIVSGHYDRVMWAKTKLAAVPFLRDAWRQFARKPA